MIGLQSCQALYAFQHIGLVSQKILPVLGCQIGHLCKSPKSRYIHKIHVLAKGSGVNGKGGSLHNIPGSQGHAFWYSQAGGKVIGGSGRNIAQKRHFLKLHHSGYGFIECAVSAAAHHHIHLFTQPGHHFHGILLLLGNVDTKLISGLGENIQYFHQLSLDLFLTGTGIEYKQHFFHPAFLPFSVTIFVNLIQ